MFYWRDKVFLFKHRRERIPDSVLLQTCTDLKLPKMVKIIIFIFFIHVIHGEVKKFNCKIIENIEDLNRISHYDKGPFLSTKVCFLANLTLTLPEKHFLPVTNDSVKGINAIYFEKSKINVLTDNVCEALPFIKVFSAKKLGLISVDETAFQKCTKISIIFLNDNSLTTLPPKIFYWNAELTKVNLPSNKLTNIDENLFKNKKNLTSVNLTNNRFRFLPPILFKNLPNLKELVLSNNQLCELSFLEKMPTSKALTELLLNGNELSDIHVESLHKTFPYLKRIVLV